MYWVEKYVMTNVSREDVTDYECELKISACLRGCKFSILNLELYFFELWIISFDFGFRFMDFLNFGFWIWNLSFEFRILNFSYESWILVFGF